MHVNEGILENCCCQFVLLAWLVLGFFDEELHTVFSYGANCDHSYCMECGFFIRSTHRRCDECDAMRTQAKAISLVMHEWYSADVVQ